jgi:hypothetical protein
VHKINIYLNFLVNRLHIWLHLTTISRQTTTMNMISMHEIVQPHEILTKCECSVCAMAHVSFYLSPKESNSKFPRFSRKPQMKRAHFNGLLMTTSCNHWVNGAFFLWDKTFISLLQGNPTFIIFTKLRICVVSEVVIRLVVYTWICVVNYGCFVICNFCCCRGWYLKICYISMFLRRVLSSKKAITTCSLPSCM